MEVTKEMNQQLADLYLNPLLNIVDITLTNPELLIIAETSLEKMEANQSTAQAVSGIMLDMNDVDKRQVELETFKVAVELLRVRSRQRCETIKAHKDRAARRNIAELMGF